MRKTFGLLGLSTAALLLMPISACDNPFATCTKGFDCPGDGDGPPSGGTSNSGGESNGTGSSDGSGGLAGDTSNSGGAGNSGGSNPSGGNGSGGENLGGACGDNCTDEKPHCIEDEATCVECTKHAHCENPAKPVCGLKNTCDPCRTNADCKDVLGLTDTPVCVNDLGLDDFGKCVGCLTEDDCGGAICDEATNTCIPGTVAGGKGLCEACVDDRECKSGQLCIEMTFPNPVEGVIGTFCLWRKDATGLAAPKGTCGINSQPYATTLPGAESVNGVVADVCTLRTTTCPALKQHTTSVEGCNAEGDDAACGVEGFNDGKCRLNGNGDPKCTYRCGGPEDCDGFTCFDTGSEKYCAL
jgi:hypothetical protein